MHRFVVASHENGRQHCPVAEQSAPRVLGSVQTSAGADSVAEGEVAASGADAEGAGITAAGDEEWYSLDRAEGLGSMLPREREVGAPQHCSRGR